MSLLSSRLRISNSKSSSTTTMAPCKCGTQHIAVAALCLSLLYGALSWYFLTTTTTTTTSQQGQSLSSLSHSHHRHHDQRQQNQIRTAGDLRGRGGEPTATTTTCPFRRYPPHRYYGFPKDTPQQQHQQQPDFLTTDTEYIYGQWPTLLTDTMPAVKLCVNQTEWRPHHDDDATMVWPFADGTNPSILSVARLRQQSAPSLSLQALLAELPSHVAWLATVCMTNSQCTWKDSDAQIQEFHLSTQTKPDTIRTVLMLLDKHFQVVQQSTIYLRVNHDWGKRVKYHQNKEQSMMIALDDARLFVHQGNVWVSFREGPGFGYESQVLNPLHFTWNDKDRTLNVQMLASETTYFCCGRNMALMENRLDNSQLLSLTWVDPITVEYVNTTAQPVPPAPKRKQQQRKNLQHGRRLSEQQPATTTSSSLLSSSLSYAHHRRLSAGNTKPHKSHIHGTNAFMLYVPADDTFLGVAHFHRPNDRQVNDFARFGHHYTHAFFTVSATPPFQLLRLSAEFVYTATTTTTATTKPNDAEIIQFSSGLELSPDGQAIILAYGINDCEAAITLVPWTTVDKWLQPVTPGQQVVDFMQPLQN